MSPANIQEVLASAAHLQVCEMKIMIAKINLQSLEDPGTHQKYTSSQIKSVVHLCSSYLESGLDLENCVDILSLADTFSLQKLRPQVFVKVDGK